LQPDGLADVRHVIGAIAWPSGEAVADILPGDGFIDIHGEAGALRRMPCRTDRLKDE
jgi:hypothetical protein